MVNNDHFRCETYNPSIHDDLIHDYMARADAPNNTSPRALRLKDYTDDKGALFLLIDNEDQIRGVTSVILEEGIPAAKIYGRLHIEKGIPHSIIDRFFEPSLFAWCLERKIRNVFMTINQENYRVLDWTSRRVGERRNTHRPNAYTPQIGAEIRSSFVPLDRLIFERFTWQYVIYSSADGGWFLKRDEKPLDSLAKDIFKREFPIATQNWS